MIDQVAPVDPRQLANLILEIREAIGLPTTQLELQKLSFFCHAAWLARHRKPLVEGFFEAWQHGPVHPTLYREFKRFGRTAITDRSVHKDIFSGEIKEFDKISNLEVRRLVFENVSALSALSASQLVEKSHAPKGPWSWTVNKARTDVALGMRIEDDVIIERHRFHSIGAFANNARGDHQDEISQFARD